MKGEKAKRQLDMLHGSIWNKLPLFAFPVAATAILEQLFNASDIAVVGNFTGAGETVAVAAVGANSSIIALIVNLFVGVAMGTNVVIANAIGRGNPEAVKKAVHTSIVVAVLGGILVAVVAQLLAAPLLRFLLVPNDVFDSALLYLRIYLLGMPVILLYNFESAIFYSVGKTRVPLVALIVSGLLNVALNLFFVAVLRMSVDGVAIATVISNVVSSVWLLKRLRISEQCIRLEWQSLLIDWKAFREIMRIGLPAGIQGAVFAVSNIVIQSAINSLGTVVIAASSAASNIEIFAYDVLNSFSQACTTFVGQNFGAGQIKRCKRILLVCLAEDLIASAAAIALVLFAGKHLLAIFSNNPEVIFIGYTRLLMVVSAYTFSMLYEVLSGYLRGFGISLVPALLTTIGVCGVRIGWIHFVFPQTRTFQTLMSAYPVSLLATALLILIALLYYRPSYRFKYLERKTGETHK